MGWLKGILMGLLILDGVLLTLIVLIQQGKGGGLATDIQGVAQASQLLGIRQAADFAEKATWVLFSALLVLTFLIHATHTASRESADDRPRTANVVNTQPAQVPATPATPAPPTPTPPAGQ